MTGLKTDEPITRNQHYLPRFWSEFYMEHSIRDGFEVGRYDADNRLVGNCRTDKVKFERIAEGFAFERYLYETDSSNPDNFVEKLLACFEGKMAALFRKLHACGQSYNLQHALSDDEMSLLFTSVNVSCIRQPDSVDRFKGNEKKYPFWNYKLFMAFATNKVISPFGCNYVAYTVSIAHIDIANSKRRFILGESGVVGCTKWRLYDKFPHKFAFFPLTPTMGVCLKGQFYHVPTIDNSIYQWAAPDEVVKWLNNLQRVDLSHGHYLKPIL